MDIPDTIYIQQHQYVRFINRNIIIYVILCVIHSRLPIDNIPPRNTADLITIYSLANLTKLERKVVLGQQNTT